MAKKTVEQTPQVEKSGEKDKKKKLRKGGRKHPLTTYIKTIFKKEVPDCSLAKESKIILENFLLGVQNRLVDNATRLIHARNRETLDTAALEAATAMLITNPTLRKHVLHNARTAVTKFKSH
jgi:hypothetical protein